MKHKNKIKIYCKCGCGLKPKKGNKYINGHNQRGKLAWNSGITSSDDDRILAGKKHPMHNRSHTDASIKKMKKSHSGVRVSLKTRKKISKALKGIPKSEKTKRKISKSLSGKNHPMYGKHLSEDHKKKISATFIENGINIGEDNPTWCGGPHESIRRVRHRRRNLGFEPFNFYFEGSEAHHIDNERVIYIPKTLHRSIRHSLSNKQSMKKINKVAFEYASIEAYKKYGRR